MTNENETTNPEVEKPETKDEKPRDEFINLDNLKIFPDEIKIFPD